MYEKKKKLFINMRLHRDAVVARLFPIYNNLW